MGVYIPDRRRIHALLAWRNGRARASPVLISKMLWQPGVPCLDAGFRRPAGMMAIFSASTEPSRQSGCRLRIICHIVGCGLGCRAFFREKLKNLHCRQVPLCARARQWHAALGRCWLSCLGKMHQPIGRGCTARWRGYSALRFMSTPATN